MPLAAHWMLHAKPARPSSKSDENVVVGVVVVVVVVVVTVVAVVVVTVVVVTVVLDVIVVDVGWYCLCVVISV